VRKRVIIKRVLLAAFSKTLARRNLALHVRSNFRDRLRHLDPIGTELFQVAGAGQPFDLRKNNRHAE
jgi:hypothetical protein